MNAAAAESVASRRDGSERGTAWPVAPNSCLAAQPEAAAAENRMEP